MTKTQPPKTLVLDGIRRNGVGTPAAQRARAQGLVPGVVYGKKTSPISIAVKARELGKLLHGEAGEHALVTLRLGAGAPAAAAQTEASAPQEGRGRTKTHSAASGAAREAGKPWEQAVLVKAVQHDPVDGHVVHVDFHAIVLTERIRVKVSVELHGEPAGVKEQGGVLEHFLREIEVDCLPTAIPRAVVFDVSQMTIGETVHVKDLAAPQDTTITSDPAGVIASVLQRKEEKPEEAEAAATEPEVITERKPVEGAEGEAAGKGEKAEAKSEKKGEEKHT